MLLPKRLLFPLTIGVVLCAVWACSPALTPASLPSPTSVPPTSTSIPIPSSPTPLSIPNGWKLFSSDRYHYSIAYPSDWKVTPAQETLTQGIPHQYDDTADVFESPGRSHAGLVEIAAQHVPEGTTLEGWTSTTIENWRNGAACEPAARESVRVTGEPATFLVYSGCLAYYILHVALVHGPSGFVIFWLSNPGNEAKDRSMFQLILGTMTFLK